MGQNQPFNQSVTGTVSEGVKLPDRKDEHSPYQLTRFSEGTDILPISLKVNGAHKDKFTSTALRISVTSFMYV
jgi:hypothetical protein